MAITAASVEANGWVLRVTLTGSLSSAIVAGYNASYAAVPGTTPDTLAQWQTNFAAYAFAARTATPAMTLSCTTSGYVQSGGTAVASSSVARTLLGTAALRKPVDATAAGARRPKAPDETDNGDGTITVRIALSQHVYQADTGLTLTALAGWRSGAGAASGIAVTNNSTVPAPAPIVRWADVPYKLQSAAFPLEVVVASHHPNGLAPVAGVRFTVTDGTTVKSFWATALANSVYTPSTDGTAKPLRVYGVTVDPTTATALTQGLLRCDYEVYPWIGPVQKSDVAGTKSMTNLGTAALATSAFVPFVVAWNPGGSWITPRYAYVNPSTGATTAAAANVSTTAATAAATPLASINLAIESLRLDAVAHTSYGTVAAANGQAAITQSLDGCRIRLAAGVTSGAGTTAVTFGANTLATWLVIEGDPADSNPRADCILQSPTTASGSSRVSRIKFSNLYAAAQTNACLSVAAAWVDNVEVQGVAGQTATTGAPFSPSGSFLWITNTKWWRHGTSPANAGTVNPILVRNCSAERSFNAPVVLNCARLPSAITGTVGVAGVGSQLLPSTDAGAALERIAFGNDLRYAGGANVLGTSYLAYASAPANLTLASAYPGASGYPVASRFAWINNVGELYGAAMPAWSGVGENNPSISTEVIVEGNTLAGDRTNIWYNDLNMATVALNDSADSVARVNRWANNVLLKNATKHDAFADPTVMSGQQSQLPWTWGRVGVALGTAKTRNWAVTVGQELVIAGSPANIYHCTTAGTTASTGGPTGTGSSIADGTAVWQWIATENRQHGYRPQALSSWPMLYGVGFEGDADMESASDTLGDKEYLFEFYGPGSQSLYADGITITTDPFMSDNSGTSNKQPYQATPTGTGGGNYKPLSSGSGTYILGRAKTANIDIDSQGVSRAIPFAAGAIEGAPVAALLPAGDRQASRAATSLVGWAANLGPVAAAMASRAAVSAVGWATTLGAALGAMPTRAAAGLTNWTTTLGATVAAMASQAVASITGWTAALVADSDRSATHAAAGVVTWQGGLIPDFDRSPTLASAPIVTTVGSWLVVVDSGRIAIVDQTLPILVPGSMTPLERTLIVAGNFRSARTA